MTNLPKVHACVLLIGPLQTFPKVVLNFCRCPKARFSIPIWISKTNLKNTIACFLIRFGVAPISSLKLWKPVTQANPRHIVPRSDNCRLSSGASSTTFTSRLKKIWTKFVNICKRHRGTSQRIAFVVVN